jgi:hypothetical protein
MPYSLTVTYLEVKEAFHYAMQSETVIYLNLKQ